LSEALTLGGKDIGYTLKSVPLSEEEVRGYYYGFANEILWPLFHDLQTRCNFDPSYWYAYEDANRKFAETIAQEMAPEDYLWIHDYHLMLVAKYLREMGVHEKTGFFLHTPFPSPDIFVKLPWRRQILESLMAYDLVGFQTSVDRNNFLDCVGRHLRTPRSDSRRMLVVLKGERQVRVGNLGISIDFDEFDRLARGDSVGRRLDELREEMAATKVILGVDRLDYSKGIPERLRAFEKALEQYEDLRGRVTLVQVVEPSRTGIPEYDQLQSEIEGLVGRINGRFTQSGWVPIHYFYRRLDRQELVAFYRLARIALVTPLKDGMNLIAMEYCAANVDESGVLVLSEFAGAAWRLGRHALIVNPYDIDGMAEAIHQASEMGWEERQHRMRRLRAAVRRRDIYWWVKTFLAAALAEDLEAVPHLTGMDPLNLGLGSRPTGWMRRSDEYPQTP
jgi:trehalose 6-phosphate synthase